MKLLRWLRSRYYSITIVGLIISIVFWIIISKGFNHRSQHPKHFLDLNPHKENNFYHFDHDAPVEIRHESQKEQPIQAQPSLVNKDLNENLALLKAQSKDLLVPLDQGNPRNIAETKDQSDFNTNLRIDAKVKDSELKLALTHSVDAQNSVILSIVDMQYLDFALNFVEGSLRKNDIKNFLLICFEKAAIAELHKANIDCFYYGISVVGDDKNSTTFGSPSYYAKTNIKTKVMLHALTLGFNILLIDLDVVLFKNPMPYLRNTSYDIQISLDRVQWNTGFMYARPTNASLELFQTAWKYFLKYHKSHDQAYIFMTLKQMLEDKTINVQELSTRQFPNGYYYFEYDRRNFRNSPSCAECVMVHNNYLGTADAKIYRFKENLLWNVDTNGYYSNPRTHYIMYSNPQDFRKMTWTQEVLALYNAVTLAELSERILVLPTFRCCDCKTRVCAHPKHNCSLMHMLKLNAFNSKYFNRYREHVFWGKYQST